MFKTSEIDVKNWPTLVMAFLDGEETLRPWQTILLLEATEVFILRECVSTHPTFKLHSSDFLKKRVAKEKWNFAFQERLPCKGSNFSCHIILYEVVFDHSTVRVTLQQFQGLIQRIQIICVRLMHSKLKLLPWKRRGWWPETFSHGKKASSMA